MNRTDFSSKIAKFCGISTQDAKQILDFITDTIGDTLANGEEIHITGFGNFYTTEVPSKPFRMPNGKIFDKEAFKAVKFAATGKLKDKVNHRNIETEGE